MCGQRQMSTSLLVVLAWLCCIVAILCCLACCAIWAGVSAAELPRPDKHVREKLKQAKGRLKVKLASGKQRKGGYQPVPRSDDGHHG
eukprot:SAG22_NODE_2634_length_2349_cov_3.712000_1_plen_87_part_00